MTKNSKLNDALQESLFKEEASCHHSVPFRRVFEGILESLKFSGQSQKDLEVLGGVSVNERFMVFQPEKGYYSKTSGPCHLSSKCFGIFTRSKRPSKNLIMAQKCQNNNKTLETLKTIYKRLKKVGTIFINAQKAPCQVLSEDWLLWLVF